MSGGDHLTKYTAEIQPERGWYRMRGVPWMVATADVPDRPVSRPIIDLTEAEANIIAFALNAVAEGRALLSGGRCCQDIEYTGPTEGVAP